jgi:hypothetical protein
LSIPSSNPSYDRTFIPNPSPQSSPCHPPLLLSTTLGTTDICPLRISPVPLLILSHSRPK